MKVLGIAEVKGLTDGAMFSFLGDNGGSWKDITSLQLSILQLPRLYTFYQEMSFGNKVYFLNSQTCKYKMEDLRERCL